MATVDVTIFGLLLLLVAALADVNRRLSMIAALLAQSVTSPSERNDAKEILNGISKQLHTVNRTLRQIRGPRSQKAEPGWKAENDERDAIRRVAADLAAEEFARFVARRSRLASDDAWVMSVVRAKMGIGMDAAITMLRQRDKNRVGSRSAGALTCGGT